MDNYCVLIIGMALPSAFLLCQFHHKPLFSNGPNHGFSWCPNDDRRNSLRVQEIRDIRRTKGWSEKSGGLGVHRNGEMFAGVLQANYISRRMLLLHATHSPPFTLPGSQANWEGG